jgi:hypothetical protein
MLEDNLVIRIAVKESVIPNIDMIVLDVRGADYGIII